MSVLYPLFFSSIGLATISHKQSVFDETHQRYVRKEKLFFVLLAIIMILFAGLRVQYNDTFTYRYGYEHISLADGFFSGIDWKIGNNPGFSVVNRFLVLLGFSSQSFLLFYAAITIGIYLWFIRKYTNNLWLSVFLFITLGCYTFTLAAIKQCVAIAFCLVGVDRVINRNTLPFVFWVVFGALFHPYALMYLFAPLLSFRPWSTKTYVLLFTFITAGYFLQSLMETVINVTTMLGEGYDASTFSGEGVNPFRLAVVSVPVLLSFVTRRLISKENSNVENLILNLTMMNAAIMFVALFGTANYFARLANYFLIFQAISIPWLFTMFKRKSQSFITASAVVCYFAFFYYANGIDQPFDYYYSSISLWQYLQSLF